MLLGCVVDVLCWRLWHVWRLVWVVVARGSARFDVVVVCGRSLLAVSAGGFAPGCGLGCRWLWALSWCVVCGVLANGAGGWGRVVRSWRGAVSFLCWWAVVSHVPVVGKLVRRGVPCGTFR